MLKESQDLLARQAILELLDLRALQGQQVLKESQDLPALQVILEPLALLGLKE